VETITGPWVEGVSFKKGKKRGLSKKEEKEGKPRILGSRAERQGGGDLKKKARRHSGTDALDGWAAKRNATVRQM